MQTFDLNLDDRDVLNNPSWSFDAMEGYMVIFDDSNQNYGRTIMRICNSFNSDVYETSFSQIGSQLHDVVEQKAKIKELISRSRSEFVDYLNVYNPLKDKDDVSLVMVYKQFLKKDQIIYRTLNMFKSCNRLLVGLVWVPTKYKEQFFSAREAISRDEKFIHVVEREIDKELTIPTYFRECEVATVGQMVVD